MVSEERNAIDTSDVIMYAMIDDVAATSVTAPADVEERPVHFDRPVAEEAIRYEYGVSPESEGG